MERPSTHSFIRYNFCDNSGDNQLKSEIIGTGIALGEEWDLGVEWPVYPLKPSANAFIDFIFFAGRCWGYVFLRSTSGIRCHLKEIGLLHDRESSRHLRKISMGLGSHPLLWSHKFLESVSSLTPVVASICEIMSH